METRPSRRAVYRNQWRRSLADALKRGGIDRLDKIAEVVINEALAGNFDAIREIANRLDGKPLTRIDSDIRVDPSSAWLRLIEVFESERVQIVR